MEKKKEYVIKSYLEIKLNFGILTTLVFFRRHDEFL